MTLILVGVMFYFIYLKSKADDENGSNGFFDDHLNY